MAVRRRTPAQPLRPLRPLAGAGWPGRWLWALWWVLAGLLPRSAQAAEYQPLPAAAPTRLAPDDWLLYDAPGNRLILYLPGYHAPAHAYYQQLQLVPLKPFPLSFTAAPGLSIFLDNRLVFTAAAAGRYTVDLGAVAVPTGRPHLLAVWQPDGYPLLRTFTAEATAADPVATPAAAVAGVLPRPPLAQSQNILLLSLLLLGVLYGTVRGIFPAGLAPITQVSELRGSANEPQVFLARPPFTWLNLALVVLFSFSLALLLTALRTDLGSLPLLRQLRTVPESAVLARVLLYTGLVLGFMLAKFLLVELLSYIFDLRELVNAHYREFLRTTLLLGLALPPVLLLYLGLHTRWPAVVALTNGAVLLLFTLTVLRVARTLHQRAPLLNLHLFAYLCATEILPLAVLLKLTVFTYSA